LQRRKEATASKEEAEEVGDQEAIDKFSRRTVKVTPEHNAECKKLLKLLGIPYVEVIMSYLPARTVVLVIICQY
jgi:flap endonuclease-1